jgi:hypothetical protein
VEQKRAGRSSAGHQDRTKKWKVHGQSEKDAKPVSMVTGGKCTNRWRRGFQGEEGKLSEKKRKDSES